MNEKYYLEMAKNAANARLAQQFLDSNKKLFNIAELERRVALSKHSISKHFCGSQSLNMYQWIDLHKFFIQFIKSYPSK